MTEPSDTQLLPCPFCGGKAEITAAEECGPQAYVVACTEPMCLSSSKVIFALKDDVTDQLVESWNKRTRSIQRSYDEETPVDLPNLRHGAPVRVVNAVAPLLAALKTIVEAGDCTVESLREGRAAIARAEGFTKDWCLNMAAKEGDAEIGAGLLALDPGALTRRP